MDQILAQLYNTNGVNDAKVSDLGAGKDETEQTRTASALYAEIPYGVPLSIEGAGERPDHRLRQVHAGQVDGGRQHIVLPGQGPVRADGDQLLSGGDLVGGVRLAGPAGKLDAPRGFADDKPADEHT